MSEPAQDLRMTTAEFLAWDDGAVRHFELVDGCITAKPAASDLHGWIVSRVGEEIGRRMPRHAGHTVKVAAGICVGDADCYLADLVASPVSPSQGGCVTDPLVIVEVLSEADHLNPAFGKALRYMELPSVQEIWLIDSRKRWFQHWQRDGSEQWIVTLPLTGSTAFESPTLGGTIALDRLYRNTGL